jgi:hypothetical protein
MAELANNAPAHAQANRHPNETKLRRAVCKCSVTATASSIDLFR